MAGASTASFVFSIDYEGIAWMGLTLGALLIARNMLSGRSKE